MSNPDLNGDVAEVDEDGGDRGVAKTGLHEEEDAQLRAEAYVERDGSVASAEELAGRNV